jgi:HSP20 family protein
MFAIQPFTRANSIFKDFDRLFGPSMIPNVSVLMPKVNISEDANAVYIHAELPGMAQEDVKITVKDDVLTIRGEKKREEKFEERNYHHIERSYGEFVRRFSLPENIRQDSISASFKNGVLEITAPKIEPEKPSEREVPINFSVN